MKTVYVSKALVVAAYRQKLVEMQRAGADVTAVVPQVWVEGDKRQSYEPEIEGGVATVVSPLRFNGHFHVHYYPELADILRRIRPDLLHMDEEPYNLATYLALRSASRLGIPSLFFSWQNIMRRYPPPFGQIERAVYKKAAGAFAGSNDVVDVLRRKGYRKPLCVIPQFGVDPAVFHPTESPQTSEFRVGFLNRLIPAKSPLLTLEALSSLPDDARLVVVGDGPLRNDMEKEIVRLKLSERVEMHERIPSLEVPGLMRTLDVVVLPSVTTPSWKEQFGRVLIEAMACRVPVIGSDSGQIPEVIGDAGIVVKEGDLSALSGALRTLYNDRALRRAMGQAGRDRVLAHFTQQRVAEQTVRAYRQVLSGEPMT